LRLSFAGEFGGVILVGHGTACRWDLRVTKLFERRRGEWVRVHRHADPLVERRLLAEVLTLLP